jgi:hypothetical protein
MSTFRTRDKARLLEVFMSPLSRLLLPSLRLPLQLILLYSLVVVGGCSSLVVTDPASPFYVPPVGSRVVVKQRLTVPPGKTRVFLQYGKVIPRSARDDYAVNCNFDINTLSDAPRYIEVGSYTVTRSLRHSDDIVQRQAVRLAALDLSAGMMIWRRDGTPVLFEEVVLTLSSTPPSDVRELACRGAMAEPTEIELPTLAEMRQALGEYADIQVPIQTPEEDSLLH